MEHLVHKHNTDTSTLTCFKSFKLIDPAPVFIKASVRAKDSLTCTTAYPFRLHWY